MQIFGLVNTLYMTKAPGRSPRYGGPDRHALRPAMKPLMRLGALAGGRGAAITGRSVCASGSEGRRTASFAGALLALSAAAWLAIAGCTATIRVPAEGRELFHHALFVRG